MKKTLAKIVNTELKNAKISYAKGRKRSVDRYPYFVGEIYEFGSPDESGRQDFEVLLRGFGRSAAGKTPEEQLDGAVETIRKLFPCTEGTVYDRPEGVIVLYTDTVQPIRTDDEDTAQVEIKLTARAWKGEIE